MIQAAETGYQKALGDQLRKDESLWANTALDAVENIVHRKCVYPGVKQNKIIN